MAGRARVDSRRAAGRRTVAFARVPGAAPPTPLPEFADAEAAWAWAEPGFPDPAPGLCCTRAAVTVTVHPCGPRDRAVDWLSDRYTRRGHTEGVSRNGRLDDEGVEVVRIVRASRVGGRMLVVLASVGMDRAYPWSDVLGAFADRPL